MVYLCNNAHIVNTPASPIRKSFLLMVIRVGLLQVVVANTISHEQTGDCQLDQTRGSFQAGMQNNW